MRIRMCMCMCVCACVCAWVCVCMCMSIRTCMCIKAISVSVNVQTEMVIACKQTWEWPDDRRCVACADALRQAGDRSQSPFFDSANMRAVVRQQTCCLTVARVASSLLETAHKSCAEPLTYCSIISPLLVCCLVITTQTHRIHHVEVSDQYCL